MRTPGSVVAWAVTILSFATGLAALWLALTVPSSFDSATQWGRLLFIVWSFVFGPIGLLILTRRAGNRIGWTALALAFTISITSITTDLTTVAGGRSTSLGLTFDLASGISWLVWITAFCWFLLLFPNGDLPSRRWGPFGVLLGAWPPLYMAAAVLAPQTLSGGARVPNPYLTIGGPVGEFLNLALNLLNYLLVLNLIGALLSTIVRFRHSRGSERQQLKWLAYWAVLLVGAIVLNIAAPNPFTIALSNLVILGLPITVAIAIFRYRLYDIDLLINRTIVYGATTAAIAATFFLGIVGLQSALRPLTSGSELAVAASTLISFALFQPIRRRVQGAVDHRFDRARYDATRTVDAFADQLRDEVDLDALRAELLGAVNRTMSPTHASLWLLEQRR